MAAHIAITGAHGVGKTTLQAELSGRLTGTSSIEPVEEFPRQRILQSGDSHFLDRAHHSPTKQMLFFIDHLMEEQRLQEQGRIGLFDRFYVDYDAYFNLLFKSGLSDFERTTLSKITRQKVDSYCIFYLPIEFPLDDGGITDHDRRFQEEIDRYILATLERSGSSFVTVRGTVSQRCDQALEVIHRKWGRHQ